MDIKQLAEQKLAQERAAEEEKRLKEAEHRAAEEQRCQLEHAYQQIGGSMYDEMRIDLTSEQQTLVQEFIAAVPSSCWKNNCRKYMGLDGKVRIVEKDALIGYGEENARAQRLWSDQQGALREQIRILNEKSFRNRRKIQALQAKLNNPDFLKSITDKFPRHGAQLSVVKTYSDEACSWIAMAIFQDGDVFGHMKNKEYLVNWLTDLMRNA